jgi:hypothetical protein
MQICHEQRGEKDIPLGAVEPQRGPENAGVDLHKRHSVTPGETVTVLS